MTSGEEVLREFESAENIKHLKTGFHRTLGDEGKKYLNKSMWILVRQFSVTELSHYNGSEFFGTLVEEVKLVNRMFIKFVYQHLSDVGILKEIPPMYYKTSDGLPLSVKQTKTTKPYCFDKTYDHPEQEYLDRINGQNRRLETFRDDAKGDWGQPIEYCAFNTLDDEEGLTYGNPDEEKNSHVDRFWDEIPENMNSDEIHVGKPGFGDETDGSYRALRQPFRNCNKPYWFQIGIHSRRYDMDATEALGGFEYEGMHRKFDMKPIRKRISKTKYPF